MAKRGLELGTRARRQGTAQGTSRVGRRAPARLRARGRLWIDLDGAPFLGLGRAALLEAVGELGSISAAARRLGMSYRKAWSLVDSMNRTGGSALVERSAGGCGGGGTRLTPFGERALALYRDLEGDVAGLCRRAERRFGELLRADPQAKLQRRAAPRARRRRRARAEET